MYGIIGTDSELRIDFDKLRRERLQKTRDQMEKEGVGAVLCFDQDNIRYITSTKLGEWMRDKMSRYCLLMKGQDPILFEIGSAVQTKKKLCPWLTDIRPAKNGFQGSGPSGMPNVCVQEIYDILKENGLQDAPIAVDIMTAELMLDFIKLKMNIVDGLAMMQRAQCIKTEEEIALLEISAAQADAGFYKISEQLKPGIRENEVCAIMRDFLLRSGAENVLTCTCASGERSFPHPHDMSDRMIRPHDMVFIDVVNDFNGYKTCYYRTFVVGYPTEQQKEVYQQCYDYMYDAISMIKPGVSTADIVKLWPTAKDLGAVNEYDAMALEVGHGVGIHHWTKPMFSRSHSFEYPEIIEENMHMAIENYATKNGDSARLEEQIVVTKDGCRVITKFPCKEPFNTWKY